MKVKISEAQVAIKKYLQAQLVPMLVGSPGCGKSQIVHAIADEFKLKLIDLRLSQCDPCDLAGFPAITEYEVEIDGVKAMQKKADYTPMAHFPIEGDPLPEGKEGWLLFLDEATSAAPAIQAAAYKLILDRMVGSHKLHKNVAIVAAGNLETDNAIVQPMSTALQSRLVHLELSIDTQEWIDWANSKQFDHRITSYMNFKPSALYTFKPDHSDKTYACPRTWEFANRIMKLVDMDEPILLTMLSGTLSEQVAREFMVFCKIYKDLPNMTSILNDPTGTKIPDDPSVLYALTGALSHNFKEDTADKMFKYMRRMPMEFQVVCLKDMRSRHGNITKVPAVAQWVTDNASKLF